MKAVLIHDDDVDGNDDVDNDDNNDDDVDDDDDDDDDDDNKRVWPLGLLAPSSPGVRCIHINHCM